MQRLPRRYEDYELAEVTVEEDIRRTPSPDRMEYPWRQHFHLETTGVYKSPVISHLSYFSQQGCIKCPQQSVECSKRHQIAQEEPIAQEAPK